MCDVLPDILCIIGAQRSGSTWLDHILNDHPEIQMFRPLRPEHKFFMYAYSNDWDRKRYVSEYFNVNATSVRWVGEKATSYLECPEVAKRIYSLSPSAQLFCVLRDPVNRALSNFYFSVANGLEKRSLEQVFIEKIKAPEYPSQLSVSPFAYIERGNYTNYLAPYIKVFGKQLNILIFEELVENMKGIQAIYGQLGVDVDHKPVSFKRALNATELSKTFCPDNVREALRNDVSGFIGATEELFGRKIPAWHD